MPRVRLEETKDWQLADRSHDVRGRELRDSVGRTLGSIKTMIVDTDARRVESIVLEDETEYPVRDLQIMEQAVYYIPAVPGGAPAAAPPAASAAPGATEGFPETAEPSPDSVAAADTADLPPAPDASRPDVADVGFTPADFAAPPPETAAWQAPPPAAEPAAPEATASWQAPETPPVAPEQERAPMSFGGWSAAGASESPAPPPMDATPETPTAPAQPEVPSSPYAPPSSYEAYTPPPPPPPYVAPELRHGAPSDPFATSGPGESGAPEATAQPLFPEDAPAADPLADPFGTSPPAYGQPASPEGVEPHGVPQADTAADLPESPAYMAPGLAAGGMAAGAFTTPPELHGEGAGDAGTSGSDVLEGEERPAEPIAPGGTSFVAPAEPEYAPGPYAGVAPEPGFPTHAAPAEAAAGHTFQTTEADVPAAEPEADAGYREHFAEHYGDAGGSYDSLATAYQFGAEAANIPELRWAGDDVLRRRFNERFGYPAEDRLAWMGARAAVKRGMQR